MLYFLKVHDTISPVCKFNLIKEFPMNRTTIIVPVYKDWTTLHLCIESLKKYVTPDNYILIVNDCGPECDELEARIITSIQGFPNFSYHRNESNLGFVLSCNAAVKLADPSTDIFLLNSDTEVTEGFLEEMRSVLYADERHGVVCPRSNNATLLTIPPRTNSDVSLTPQISHSIYSEVKYLLPSWTIIPTGVGFAFLIKRNVLNRFGLFDEVYSPGYNEENDFCMRINQYGFSIVMANRAYVYHYESKSFGDKRTQLNAGHYSILSKRYPYYSGIINNYYAAGMEPVDYFADLIGDGLYQKKRILFSLYELPATHNGTARYSISIYETFVKLYSDKYDIHLLVNRAADKFHKLSKAHTNVWYPDTIGSQTFHIAYSPSQIYHIEHMLILNRTCLKYVFCMQDIIYLRSSYLLIQDRERKDVLRASIHYCDLMTSISRFSLKDTIDYYSTEFDRRNIPTRVIYHGTDKQYIPDKAKSFKLPYKDYFVVFGNVFKHKFIPQLLEVLKTSDHEIIVIGSTSEGPVANNIYGYKSGTLTEEFIDYVLGNSLGIIFPSVYEGFGLPFLDGMTYNKKIVVNNTELNHELCSYFDAFSDNVYIFNSLDEVNEILNVIKADPVVQYKNGNSYIRSWEDSAEELENCLADVLEAPVNANLLYERWHYYNYLSGVHRNHVANSPIKTKKTRSIEMEGFLQGLINRFPRIYNIYRKTIEKINPGHYN